MYDKSWAEQVKVESGDCPAIDGVYQNRGETFSKGRKGRLDRQELSLAHLVNGGFASVTHRADDRLGTTYYEASKDDYQTIGLRLEGSKLYIDATRKGGNISKIVLPVHHHCRNSLLVLESDWGYDPFSASAGHGYYAFGRAQDGSLLAYRSATAEALVVFWASTASWVRFPPATPATTQEKLSAVTP